MDVRTGKAEFGYPGKQEYVVLCNNLKLAKSWLLDFAEATSNIVSNKPAPTNLGSGVDKPGVDKSAVAATLPKIINISGSNGEIKRPGNGFQYGCGGGGGGTLIQSRQEKERSKLFYELGQTVLQEFIIGHLSNIAIAILDFSLLLPIKLSLFQLLR